MELADSLHSSYASRQVEHECSSGPAIRRDAHSHFVLQLVGVYDCDGRRGSGGRSGDRKHGPNPDPIGVSLFSVRPFHLVLSTVGGGVVMPNPVLDLEVPYGGTGDDHLPDV